MGKEALVVCSDKSLSVGITVWDIETGDQLFHIPTSASPPRGFLCLKNHFLVASQVQKQGSVAGGVIFIWPLNKPQAPLRNYTIEAIGPICCTKDGIYLAGGTPTGNCYIWEVSSGRILKSWRAHKMSINCLTFSIDNCFLISGSNNGEICVWSTISLLDYGDHQSAPSFLHCWSEHHSCITGLLVLGSSSSVLISSSLDGTCKIWELISGKLMSTHVFSQAITTITVDPEEQFLFSGSADGKIYINKLDVGLEEEDALVLQEDQCLMVLNGHMGAVTALCFSISGPFLISASEDCIACLWDVNSWEIIRIYRHHKGRITNILVIPHSEIHHKISHCLSRLDKYPHPECAFKGSITFLPTYCSLEDDHMKNGFRITDTMNQHIVDLQQEQTVEAIQMKVDANVEKRLWATNMAKQITEMNKQLRSQLLNLMQSRLSCEMDYTTAAKRKKFRVKNAPHSEEECR